MNASLSIQITSEGYMLTTEIYPLDSSANTRLSPQFPLWLQLQALWSLATSVLLLQPTQTLPLPRALALLVLCSWRDADSSTPLWDTFPTVLSGMALLTFTLIARCGSAYPSLLHFTPLHVHLTHYRFLFFF